MPYITADGVRDFTPEEISAMKAEEKLFELMEKSRPFTSDEVIRMLIAAQINALHADDNTALRMLEYYPEWSPNTAYPVGFKVQRSGKLSRVVQAHTSQTGWEPENATSLWENINETNAGTAVDPIPWVDGMDCYNGKYYSYQGKTYLCKQDMTPCVWAPGTEGVWQWEVAA